MRQMGSITRLPSDMPPLEDELVQRPDSVWERVQNFCQEFKARESRNGNLTEWL